MNSFSFKEGHLSRAGLELKHCFAARRVDLKDFRVLIPRSRNRLAACQRKGFPPEKTGEMKLRGGVMQHDTPMKTKEQKEMHAS